MYRELVKKRFGTELEYNTLAMFSHVNDVINRYPTRVIAEFTSLDENYINKLKAREERISDISLQTYAELMSIGTIPDWYYAAIKIEKPNSVDRTDSHAEKGKKSICFASKDGDNTKKLNPDYAKLYDDAAIEAKTKIFGREGLPNTMTIEEMKTTLIKNGWHGEFEFDGDEESDKARLALFLYSKLDNLTKEIYQEKKDGQLKHEGKSDDWIKNAAWKLLDDLFGKGNVLHTNF